MDTQPQKLFKVLLIGDSCIDQYKIGTVDRLSPEAPVPVVKIIDEYNVPGMASNVYLNLQNLGIDIDFEHNQETITKTRFIDKRSGQHLLRVDKEPPLAPWDGRTPSPITSYDAVVISDYNKGFLEYEHIENIISEASGPVFIDTKKTDLERFEGAYLKINEVEYRSCKSKNSSMIVTLGSRGAMYKNCTNEEYFPTDEVPVVDVCGCGDTFLSALVFKFLRNSNIQEAIKFANKASSITVQKQGNYAPTLKEINDRY